MSFAFAPKSWNDLPLTSTPIDAAALIDLETRVTDYVDDRAGDLCPTVASATTVTLPDTSSVIKISGTTTITSVAASWAGRRVTLIFLGILTFTNGSNLKLAGSNMTTSASDTITLVSDGTLWYECSRSANTT